MSGDGILFLQIYWSCIKLRLHDSERFFKWFFMGDFSEASKEEEDNIIDIEDADFDEIIPEEKHES